MPSTFALHQNYPNPFNPSTTISFDMPLAGQVRLTVYNMLGQEITTLVNGQMASGRASIVWNATDHAGVSVASGVYFYQLNVSGADGTDVVSFCSEDAVDEIAQECNEAKDAKGKTPLRPCFASRHEHSFKFFLFAVCCMLRA